MTDSPSAGTGNIFLSGALPPLFARTATPIISVMVVNGLFTLVDAWFLGRYVGAAALTAVTLMFPVYMVLVASSTLVANGFSSLYARLLGAGERAEADIVLGQAIRLALVICGLLIAGFALAGGGLALAIAKGSTELAGYGHTYIAILIYCSPLVFALAIGIDALRAEGLLAAMAAITMLSALLNIAFDYLFIAGFGWGVAGSAWGTVAAQCCSILALLVYRARRGKRLFPGVLSAANGVRHWSALLALGAPTSLGYVGIALSSGLTIYCLQLWAGPGYEATAGAFGIVTRLLTFTYLPLLGLSMAFQTIAGNNFGAKAWPRSDGSLNLALRLAVVYCVGVQVIYYLTRTRIGWVFIDDTAIIAEIGRILPLITAMFWIFGPLMIVSAYFQAIGDARRAAVLGLSRTYLFSLPLTFALPFWVGEIGIWVSGIVTEVLVFGLTVLVLSHRARRMRGFLGLFQLPRRGAVSG